MTEPEAPRAHFAIFGFPVRIHPFFWVVTLMFGASGLGTEWSREVIVRLASWIGIVFVSILWHELGHAFAMRRYGYSPWILLHGLGGATSWGSGPAPPRPKVRVVVSLAGPFAGFLLGIPFLVADLAIGAGFEGPARDVVRLMWFVNIFWGACNLVPMLPWDGGMALHGALDHLTGGQGLKPTAVVTLVVGLVCGALLLIFAPGEWWILFLVVISIMHGVRALNPRRAAPSARAPLDPMRAIAQARAALERAGDPVALTRAILTGTRSEGWARVGHDLVTRVAEATDSPSQRAMALELGAWALLLGGEPAAAARATRAMQPSHDPSPILAALVAARTNRPSEALAAAEEMDPDEAEARRLIEAHALAFLGRLDEALDALGDDAELGGVIDAALFHAERYDLAAEFAERLFGRFARPTDAYNAACSHSRAGRIEEALRWLDRAIDAGFDDVRHLETDADLAAARAAEGYAAIRARLG